MPTHTSRFTWSRPTTHIYSYNREAQSVLASRSARATSVSAATSETTARSSRAASVATGDSFTGYSGYYGRQLAMINQRQGPTAAAAAVPLAASLRAGSPSPTIYPAKAMAASAYSASASSASATASSMHMSSSKATTTTTSTKQTSELTRLDRAQSLKAHEESLAYGKRSSSRALRRAEMHAVSSGKDPRHTVLPRSLGDDICKVVADLHVSPYESKEVNAARASYQQGRLKVERMEKELGRVTDAAMSYKSAWTKSASQMAREAIEACDMEAASTKKVRRTVVEERSRQVAAA